MKIMLLIIHTQVIPNPLAPSFIFEHKLRFFRWNPRALTPWYIILPAVNVHPDLMQRYSIGGSSIFFMHNSVFIALLLSMEHEGELLYLG